MSHHQCKHEPKTIRILFSSGCERDDLWTLCSACERLPVFEKYRLSTEYLEVQK